MRSMRKEELAVLERLLEMVPNDARPHPDYEPHVEDMADGGMGGIRFVVETGKSRKMGRELVTAEYIDEDQVPVLISINLDEDGRLFEIDFWKVDYKPLKRYPRQEELHIAPPPATIRPKPP